MIGRIHIISFSTIILLYVLVAAWKYLPVFSEVENEIVVENRSDQADIVKFWEQYYRASSYRSEKDYEQAAAYYEKALELNE